jgi:hypothetical protein
VKNSVRSPLYWRGAGGEAFHEKMIISFSKSHFYILHWIFYILHFLNHELVSLKAGNEAKSHFFSFPPLGDRGGFLLSYSLFLLPYYLFPHLVIPSFYIIINDCVSLTFFIELEEVLYLFLRQNKFLL